MTTFKPQYSLQFALFFLFLTNRECIRIFLSMRVLVLARHTAFCCLTNQREYYPYINHRQNSHTNTLLHNFEVHVKLFAMMQGNMIQCVICMLLGTQKNLISNESFMSHTSVAWVLSRERDLCCVWWFDVVLLRKYVNPTLFELPHCRINQSYN